jgi:SAM-dependent methyltransferase
VQLFEDLFALGLEIYDHRESAYNFTYVEARLWATWEPFVETVNAALAQPRLVGPAPKAGNTTRDVVERHFKGIIFLMSELQSSHPFMILDVAQRVALRTAHLIENLAMTANLNFYITKMQMQAAEGEEYMLDQYGDMDAVSVVFHDVPGKRWDVLIWLLNNLPSEGLPPGQEALEFSKPGIAIAEVGVENGNTSARLLEQLPQVMTHVGVDPYSNNDAQFEATKEKLDVYGRTKLVRLNSSDAASFFPPECFDLVFLDARHDHWAVVEDVLAWSGRVKPGGILSGHDWNWMFPPVAQAIFRLASTLLPKTVHISSDGVWWWQF